MNTSMHIQTNFQVLVWARESIALSKNQVVEKTNISATKLNQLELGEKLPTLDELKKLSKVYKRTIATLLLDTPPKEKPLPKDRRTINSENQNIFHEKTILAVRKARALANSYLELRTELGIETRKFNLSAKLNEDPKHIALTIRKTLKLDELKNIKKPIEALEYSIEQCEQLGIMVFQLSLTKDNVRGFAITDDIVPIIGIKRGQETPQSKLFSLFHELGHIILNEGGICDLSDKSTIKIEKWCNAFSAEILIPTAEFIENEIVLQYIENDNKNWSLKDLVVVGNAFKASPLAILRSLLENKLVTKEFYAEKHEKWNKPQFGRAKIPEGRNISKEAIQEKGRTYVSLAFRAFDRNRIDLKDLSDFLGVKLSYITKTRQLLYI
jgi:Zn-dependent peptidase ImmA (M78 family)